MMIEYQKEIVFETEKQIDFVDITKDVEDIVNASKIKSGSVSIFAPHTTLGLIINHNEPMLLQDFTRILYKLAPADDQYAHDIFELSHGSVADGRSNGHSHCKAMLTGTNESVPIKNGMMMLSRTQSIFAIDFDGPRKRNIIIQVLGI